MEDSMLQHVGYYLLDDVPCEIKVSEETSRVEAFKYIRGTGLVPASITDVLCGAEAVSKERYKNYLQRYIKNYAKYA